MNSNEHEPSPDDDIFPDSIPAKTPPSAETASGASGAAATATPKRSLIKPVHVFAVAAAVAMFWAVGMPLLSSHKSAPSAPTASMASDTDLPTYKRRHDTEASTSDAAPGAGATAEPFEEGSPPATSAAPQPARAPTPSAQAPQTEQPIAASAPQAVTAQQIEALGQQVTQLQLALAQAQAGRDTSTCVSNKPVATRHATSARRLSLQGIPTPARASAPASSDLGVLTGYRLNTIYRGQAWVEHSQKTYVVEAGQEFDGLTVIQVDAKTRRVVTAQGEIR